MAKQIDIACARLRAPYLAALRKIFGRRVALEEITLEDLPPLRAFLKHAQHCADCERLRKEQNKALKQIFEEW